MTRPNMPYSRSYGDATTCDQYCGVRGGRGGMAVDAVLRGLGRIPWGWDAMNLYDHEHPRGMPVVNRDYDPVLRRWNHPPPRWIWGYRAEPTHSAWDIVAGCLGLALLGLLSWGILIWAF